MNYEWFDGSSSNSQGSGSRQQQGGRGRFATSSGQRGQPPRPGNQRQGGRDTSKPSYHGVTPPKPSIDDSWKKELPQGSVRPKKSLQRWHPALLILLTMVFFLSFQMIFASSLSVRLWKISTRTNIQSPGKISFIQPMIRQINTSKLISISFAQTVRSL